MREMVYGPRRVNSRRIVSVPRPVLRAISLEVPGMVMVVVAEGRIFVRPYRDDAGRRAVTVSKVGQVMLPPEAVDTLGIDGAGAVYARVSDGGTAIELLPAASVSVRTTAA